ncbi:hypothetical protein [Spiroplasma endosymbiont of Othius punctulatus]|uniref:hypothetical protein n=1 Tax=Spiroplasma endosymbiont of Othius punctulatus TaxID=3066289 RepID=UPI0030CC4703
MLIKLKNKLENIFILFVIVLIIFFAIDKIDLISRKINYNSMIVAFMVLSVLVLSFINATIFCLAETRNIKNIKNINKINKNKKVIFALWIAVIFAALVTVKFFMIFMETYNLISLEFILRTVAMKYLFLVTLLFGIVAFVLFVVYTIINVILKMKIKRMRSFDHEQLIIISKNFAHDENEDKIVKLFLYFKLFTFFKNVLFSNFEEELEVTILFSQKLKEIKKAQTPPLV